MNVTSPFMQQVEVGGCIADKLDTIRFASLLCLGFDTRSLGGVIDN